MSRRILVTGAAGRLGRSTVEVLRACGHDVLGLDREPAPTVDVVADLMDATVVADTVARARPEAIVHLAAIAVPFSAPERVIFTTNTTMAFNVCEAATSQAVDAVVVASSPTVLGYGNPNGWQPAYLPLDEVHPVAPWNAYALSKVATEEMVRTFSRASGGRTAFSAVRPCFVIAPEEWEGAPTQQGHTVRERLEQPEHAAVALFNYVDARDAAAMFERIVTDRRDAANGEVFLASAVDALATRPLAELLPRFHPGTDALARDLGAGRAAFSHAKASRLLGWRPTRTWATELRDAATGPDPDDLAPDLAPGRAPGPAFDDPARSHP